MILMGMGVQAQIIRVTTWDMAEAMRSEKSPQAVIEKSADQLKTAAPDVILLRGVSGWKMCSQLAEALKPSDYRVVVCSSFREPAGTNAARSQVAILAKNTAYFSWSESWNFETGASPAGGFAFAAVQIAGHRFGFSSLEFPRGQTSTSGRAAKQWLDTLGSFRAWANNRLEGFVAGTSGLNSTDAETVRLLRATGFADPLAGRKQTPDAREPIEAHLVPNADAPGGLVLSSWPTTCEFDFRPAPIIVVLGSTNLDRFSLSYRMGFNISAKFKGLGGYAVVTPPGNPQRTPNGDPWNYDNGYVYPDTTQNAHPGNTWYYGYSAGTPQRPGGAPTDFDLYRSSSPAGINSRDKDGDPQHGVELTYNRQVGRVGNTFWGIEAGLSFMDMTIHDNRTYNAAAVRTTDTFRTGDGA